MIALLRHNILWSANRTGKIYFVVYVLTAYLYDKKAGYTMSVVQRFVRYSSIQISSDPERNNDRKRKTEAAEQAASGFFAKKKGTEIRSLYI